MKSYERKIHLTHLLQFTLVLSIISVSTISAQTNRDHSFVRQEINAVQTVRSTGGPKYDGELFSYSWLLELREDATNEESFLFHPQNFTCDSEGHYYVSDIGNHRVAVFDSTGQYSYSFGKWGQGPGEFEIVDILCIRDGVITLFDSMLLRSTRYTTDGILIEVLTSLNLHGRSIAIHRANNDRIVSLQVRQPSTDTHGRWQACVEILDSAGTLIANMETEALKTGRFTSWIGSEGGGSSRGSTAIPYSSRPRALYHPMHGIIITTGIEPVIEVYDINGMMIKRIEIDLPPVPVSRRERAEARQRYQSWIEAFEGYRREMSKRQLNALEFPSHKANWSDIYIDDAGYFWLREPSNLGFWEQTHLNTTFKVLSPEGEYLGRTSWPASSRQDMNLRSHIADSKLMVWIEDEIEGSSIPTVYQIQSVITGFHFPK